MDLVDVLGLSALWAQEQRVPGVRTQLDHAAVAAFLRRCDYSGTGRVAATASSWFAWYSTAASAVRAARAS